MRLLKLLAGLLLASIQSLAQNNVAINNDASLPHASAMLHVQSTTKGMLVPRMTQAQRSAIASPATGLLVFQTDNVMGYWYYNGAIWITLQSGLTGWSTSGNAGTNPAVNFIGTTDAQPLRFRVNGQTSGLIDQSTNDNTSFGYLAFTQNVSGVSNTAIGKRALSNNTTGQSNTAAGAYALAINSTGTGNSGFGLNALGFNQTGNGNTAVGGLSLYQNTSGSNNLSLGGTSLYSNTTGSHNTSVGTGAMFNNTTGYSNVAIGTGALFNSRVAANLVAVGDSAMFNQADVVVSGNTAIGSKALYSNWLGSANTAIGFQALFSNTNGNSNAALGVEALHNNQGGSGNTAVGNRSLYENVGGRANVATGYHTLPNNLSGDSNTVVGFNAANNNQLGNNNVVVGNRALSLATTSGNNTVIGSGAGYWATGSGNIFLGYNAGYIETGSNKLYIENSNANKNNALIFGDFAADSLRINGSLTTDGYLQVTGNNWIEMGYGVAGKELNAGVIGYGIFTPNALDIVGGGTLPTNRVIKFWAEGGAQFKGHVLPDVNGLRSCGASGLRWTEVWAVNGTIQTSDARLKKDIIPLEYGLTEVMQLKPVSFSWKDEKSPARKLGLIAQDVQQIIPELVIGNLANGEHLGMNYGELVPVLIKAIQEQQQLVDAQQKLVEKMDQRIRLLEKQIARK